MDVKSVGMKGVDWVNLSQDRDKWWCLAKTVMNHRVRHSAEKFFTGQTSVGQFIKIVRSVYPTYLVLLFAIDTFVL